MAYVVTAPCDRCKYTDCVEACPVDAFREGDRMVYIDPEECIVCDACVSQCPVETIFPEEEVPPVWTSYIELNANMAVDCPPITEKKPPLAGEN